MTLFCLSSSPAAGYSCGDGSEEIPDEFSTEGDSTSILMPDVRGLSVEDANSILIAAGMTVHEVFEVDDNTIAAGYVSETIPAPGTEVYPGVTHLTLLLARHYILMPDLRGLSVEDANSILIPAGLNVTKVLMVDDNTIASGLVSDTIPSSGTVVYPGVTPVTLRLARHYIFMPNLRGFSVEDANAALTTAGLILSGTVEVDDNSIAAGLVSNTIPASDTVVYPGQTPVTLRLARHYIFMPNLRGFSVEDANAALTTAGLILSGMIEVDDNSIAAGLVSGTHPAAGTKVYPGLTQAVLFIAKHITYSGGDGSAENPYEIGTVADWQHFMVTTADWVQRHFILTGDIDLNGISLTPVGNSINKPFNGVIDGNGHTISNVVIDTPNSSYVGLFGCLGNNGQIKNLGVENVRILGYDYVGGLCGRNEYGTIVGCYVTGTVTGYYYYTGGLCGHNKGTISQCSVSGTVTGTRYVGGLLGRNYEGAVSNCYTTGNVSGTGTICAGGLIGQNIKSKSKIRFCHAASNVMVMTGTSGYIYVGGLIGLNGEESTHDGGKIDFCEASGNVTVNKGTNRYVGGLVGYNYASSIDSCRAFGEVREDCTGSSKETSVGGLVGSMSNRGILTNSFATGTVSGEGKVGGLVGYLFDGNLSNCYATGAVSESLSDKGIGSAGGLAGYVLSSSVSDCYATGPVGGTFRVGGLVGYHASGTLAFCYSSGTVSGTGEYRGGLLGYKGASGTTSSCFWDTETSLLSVGVGYGSSTGVIGKTTNDMQTFSTFTDAGWHFGNTDGFPEEWKIPSGGGYPVFIWQPDIAVSAYSGGSGTADDPYHISTVADFQQLSLASCDWSKSFILTADLDLSDLSFTESPFAPDVNSLYCGFQGVAFSGVFDGNGYILGNLNIQAHDKDYVGMFGRITGGQIKNLRMENAAIEGRSYVGGIAGLNYYGRITNCHAAGVVTGTGHYVGGLMGYNIRGSVESCSVEIAMGGGSSVGGLVGENGCGTIRSSFASGYVTVEGTSTYCYAGGLTGWNSGKIVSSYNTATVSAKGYDLFVGGVTGVLFSGEISSVYTTGKVVSQSVSSNYSGGLAGYISDGSIGHSYSIGAVTATGESGSVGGFAGEMASGTSALQSCFWDIEASGLTYSAGGKGLTSDLIRAQTVFQNANWGDKEWIIENGIDTPRLCWEKTIGKAIPLPQPLLFAGSGTWGDPYQIYTAAEFASLSWHSNALDKFFILMNDLDLEGITLYPIGDLGSFVGGFNGNGHTLKNVVIHQPGSDRVGLFGSVGQPGFFFGGPNERITIQNLGLLNVDIQGDDYVGGLAGKHFAGRITSCYTTGSVISTGWYAGGLVGWFKHIVPLTSPRFTSQCHSACTVIGTEYVGGLAGLIHNITDYRISSCSASGDVFGYGNVGGLVGLNAFCTISNCAATGLVHGDSLVGGLAGENYFGTLSNCFFAGRIVGEFNPERLGGFCGYNNQGVFSNCFWDMETSGLSTGVGGGIADGVMGKTTGEMRMLSTFVEAGWDFGSVWAICEGMNTPRLQWQIPTADWVCPDGVGMEDLGYFAMRWLMGDCGASGGCEGGDLDGDGTVGLADWAVLAGQWMAE